jgi:transcriptional regulator with XRE-family HTH domain
MDRVQLADFLRARRESLQPEDVGLPRGPRRRTAGLRREEVAALSGVSGDYYSRIEQRRGPVPSEQILAALAQGMHLTIEERDHLFRLAGHAGAPAHPARRSHQRGNDARPGPHAGHPGAGREPPGRDAQADPPGRRAAGRGDRLHRPRAQPGLPVVHEPAGARDVPRRRPRPPQPEPDRATRRGPRAHRQELPGGHARRRAARTKPRVRRHLGRAPRRRPLLRTQAHPAPRARDLELYGQTLLDPDQFQTLIVFTAHPGSESHEKLQLLPAVGARRG